jgi:Mg/Co/Ni transporter MgtE
MDDNRPPRQAREPRLFGLIPRERAYLIMMGVCLLLIVLAWTLIYRYSTVAAVVMSVVALVIPPVAAIIGNAGPVNRQ